MGVQSDVGYTLPRTNALQRLIQRFGQTRLGTLVLSRGLRTLDLFVHRLSGGRTTFARVLGGFPIIMLTTTGAHTGLARTNPLTAIPHGDDIAVLGANYGLGVIPSWVHNLRAESGADLTYRGRTVKVTAREVTGREAEDVLAAACLIFPGYALYRKRFADDMPAFVLEARR